MSHWDESDSEALQKLVGRVSMALEVLKANQMTLRDKLAAAALPGAIAAMDDVGSRNSADVKRNMRKTARIAYQIADEMLAEREQPTTEVEDEE